MTENKVSEVTVEPPTEPGFYKYSGGNQSMIFLLVPVVMLPSGKFADGLQWYVINDNGSMSQCLWEYIEQALGVWELEKIT